MTVSSKEKHVIGMMPALPPCQVYYDKTKHCSETWWLYHQGSLLDRSVTSGRPVSWSVSFALSTRQNWVPPRLELKVEIYKGVRAFNLDPPPGLDVQKSQCQGHSPSSGGCGGLVVQCLDYRETILDLTLAVCQEMISFSSRLLSRTMSFSFLGPMPILVHYQIEAAQEQCV